MGRLLTRGEEAKEYWSGGGEALRCKRRREWDMGAWEEWEIMEEEALGMTDTANVEGDVEWGGKDGMEDVKCDNVMSDKSCEGCEVKMDGGGDVCEEIGGRQAAETKRRTLRGKRRVKKGERMEGDERLANAMARWLGTRPI